MSNPLEFRLSVLITSPFPCHSTASPYLSLRAHPPSCHCEGHGSGPWQSCFFGSPYTLGTRYCHIRTKPVPPRDDVRGVEGHWDTEIATSPKMRAPRNDVGRACGLLESSLRGACLIGPWQSPRANSRVPPSCHCKASERPKQSLFLFPNSFVIARATVVARGNLAFCAPHRR